MTVPPDVRPLAAQLADAMAVAEHVATSAGYPRQSTLSAIEKAAWELFYRSDAVPVTQAAALDAVASLPTTPVGREAVRRLQAELALDW